MFIAHSQFQDDLDGAARGGRGYRDRAAASSAIWAPAATGSHPALLRGESAEEIVDLREGLASMMVHAVHATGGVVELPHRFTVEPS